MRAATFSREVELPPLPDLPGGTDEDVDSWRRWLEQVWADSSVAEAIEIASPILARRVLKVCEGSLHQPRQVRRMVVSVARYLLRMTSRATPFGLFAGVAPVGFGPGLAVRWGADHHVVARADSGWLAGVIGDLESCTELLRRLPIVLNNLCFVRGGRLVVSCQQQPPAAGGRTAPAEVSVRRTRVVAAVEQGARSPIRFSELTDKLDIDFPGASREVIERVLAELVVRRVLLTSLRPPTTATDALGHVLEQLSRAGADTIAHLATQARELRAVHDELSRHNRASGGDRRAIRASVTPRMTALSGAITQPLAVDLRLDCELVLPEQVAREAERAASALALLTPHPFGFPSWRDYHARFLERYGSGALIPVRELVRSDSGLGFPAGFRDSIHQERAQPLSDRDTRILALAQQAAIDGGGEVLLDDKAIAGLAAGELSTARMPAHTELSIQVHTPSREALDRGDFALVIASVSRAAGTLTGRFLNLLDGADRDRVAQAYAGLPTAHADALPAQVSCTPLYPRTENVARSPQVRPYVLSLAEHHTHSTCLIPLDDLAVSGDAQRLYLVSLSQRRPVEPTVFNAVESRNAMHPLARFLSEITKAGDAAVVPFDWGPAASCLPFLPRLRYGRTVLAPARWKLSGADLPGPRVPWSRWEDSFTATRRRFRLPRAVYLGEDDRRVRLELDEPAHVYLVRSHLDRTAHATLTEAPDSCAYGWLQGRAHEIVLPLASTAQNISTPRRFASQPISREHGHLPGASDWLFVKIYGHPDRQVELLSTHVLDLISGWTEPPQWWYLRYQDPEPHLRLRFLLTDAAAYAHAMTRVAAWTADLRGLGLVSRMQLDTYYPETGRYGTGPIMAAAEAVFAADSAAAITQLTSTTGGGPHPYALTAASFLDIVDAFTACTDEGMRWLIDHIHREPTPAPARQVHDEAVRLADPLDNRAALRTVPGGEQIAAAWARRRPALITYRDRLTNAGEPDPDMVLVSLLHMHHIRMNGIDEKAERACRRLARAAALAWTARAGRREP